jgi:hypothetical protein
LFLDRRRIVSIPDSLTGGLVLGMTIMACCLFVFLLLILWIKCVGVIARVMEGRRGGKSRDLEHPEEDE